MADVTIYDFLAWCAQIIDASKLSALMSEYGYSDDSPDSVVNALQYDDGFADDFAQILAEGVIENNIELNRAIGGISVNNDTFTVADWLKVAKSTQITRATGDAEAATTTFDWNALVAGVLTTAASIVGSVTGTSKTTTATVNADTSSSGSSSVALYIIIAVVFIAIIAILWLSVSGAKK